MINKEKGNIKKENIQKIPLKDLATINQIASFFEHNFEQAKNMLIGRYFLTREGGMIRLDDGRIVPLNVLFKEQRQLWEKRQESGSKSYIITLESSLRMYQKPSLEEQLRKRGKSILKNTSRKPNLAELEGDLENI